MYYSMYIYNIYVCSLPTIVMQYVFFVFFFFFAVAAETSAAIHKNKQQALYAYDANDIFRPDLLVCARFHIIYICV